VTREEFRVFALTELANHDTRRVVEALQGGEGLMTDGIAEIVRWARATKAFPTMSIPEMWAVDRNLSAGAKRGRPSKSDLERAMTDPAWTAVSDLERLKTLWHEIQPGEQVPLEFLTDISVEYRGAARVAVEGRRGRAKGRLIPKE
jgi:hypothetical protein